MMPLTSRERLMHEYRLAELRLADKIERELSLPRPKPFIDDGFYPQPPSGGIDDSSGKEEEGRPGTLPRHPATPAEISRQCLS